MHSSRSLLLVALVAACAGQHADHADDDAGSAQPSPTPLWAVTLDLSPDLSVAVDAEGNVIVGGRGFVSERDAFDGSERWTTVLNGIYDPAFEDLSASWVLGVGAAGDGSVFATGFYRGSVDFGGTTLTTASDNQFAFLAKYSPQGALEWVEPLGIEGTASALVVTPDGQATVCGGFFGTIQLGSQSFDEGAGVNSFVASYDATGAFVWGTAYISDMALNAMALASNGDVLAAGEQLDASVAQLGLSQHTIGHAFVARFSSAGEPLSSRTLSDDGRSTTGNVAFDADGDLVVQASESPDGSAWDTDLHVLGNDGELWNAPDFGVVVPTDLGPIIGAEWDADTTPHMAVETYAETGGAPTINSSGSGSAAAGFGAGAAGPRGAAVFVGWLGGTIDVGTGPLSPSSMEDGLIVHLPSQ